LQYAPLSTIVLVASVEGVNGDVYVLAASC
jgi:hypothetical protein